MKIHEALTKVMHRVDAALDSLLWELATVAVVDRYDDEAIEVMHVRIEETWTLQTKLLYKVAWDAVQAACAATNAAKEAK